MLNNLSSVFLSISSFEGECDNIEFFDSTEPFAVVSLLCQLSLLFVLILSLLLYFDIYTKLFLFVSFNILLSTFLCFILISLISKLSNSTNAIRNVFRKEEEKIKKNKKY